MKKVYYSLRWKELYTPADGEPRLIDMAQPLMFVGTSDDTAAMDLAINYRAQAKAGASDFVLQKFIMEEMPL